MNAKYGPWALITGASSGIGEAMARHAAREGLSVILVARRVERLRALAGELPGASLVVQADLADPAAIEVVRDAIGEREVGLVCANAGFGDKGAFVDITLARHREMVRVNCEATLATVHTFAPAMIARGRGGIVIVSSTAAFQGVPLTAAYAASKAFDLVLAEGLAIELAPHGVDVVALCPGATDTEGPKRTGVNAARVPFGFASADEVARSAFAALGRRTIALPRNVDRLAALSSRFLPRSVAARVAGRAIARVTGR